MEMSPRQTRLARHALGLPNESRKSYRNRFVAGPGHDAYQDWMGMVSAGAATQILGETGNSLFRLTQAGAELALIPPERLCPEDFPNSTKAAKRGF